jgi:hypothetical protein
MSRYFNIKQVSLINVLINFLAQINCRELVGLEKLIKNVFIDENYNSLVRPINEDDGITYIKTELKILQIDLVRTKLILGQIN